MSPNPVCALADAFAVPVTVRSALR